MGNQDNVIRPVFGAKGRTAEPERSDSESATEASGDSEKSVSPPTGDSLVQAQKDLLYLLTHMAHAQSMRDRLEKLGDMIFSLANFTPNTQSIELRRQGLRSLSLEEICDLAAGLNEVQVRMQPSYLGALTLEHSARLDAALSLMNESDDSE